MLSLAAWSPLYFSLGTSSTTVSDAVEYIQGPEPVGWAASWSSVWLAGQTRTMARRSLRSEKFATVVVIVTALSPLASMEAIGASMAV